MLLASLFAIPVFRHAAARPFANPPQAASAARTPVLVELFTSEGCSDCPPADALLAQLARTQPVPGAQVIVLEHHVDYWDHQGWRDPFSSSAATQRQEAYAASFGNPSAYTPQMVVDGTAEFVGSNEGAARRAIERAEKSPKAPLELQWAKDMAHFGDPRPVLEIRVGKISDPAAGGPAEVFLAATEDNLHSNVGAGENSGRALDHSGVVRRFESLGKADASKDPAFVARPILNLGRDWKRANLHVVVFVQQVKSRHVLAAASIPFPAQ